MLRGYLIGHAVLSFVAGMATVAIRHVTGVRPAMGVGPAAALLVVVPAIGPLL